MKKLLPFSLIALALALAGCATTGADYKDPAALASLIQRKAEPYLLVDVRTPEEYAGGHIPTATNSPVETIETNLPTQDTSALIIVYCHSGRRSALAKQALDGLGYKRVVDFGAVSRWTGELVSSTTSG